MSRKRCQALNKSYPLFDDAHFWIVAKYIERNPIKAAMIQDVALYKYQSFFQWKYKHKYFELLNSSKIFDMTFTEYRDYISSEMDVDAIDIVYKSPKLIIKEDGKFKVLDKRLETIVLKLKKAKSSGALEGIFTPKAHSITLKDYYYKHYKPYIEQLECCCQCPDEYN